MEQVTVCTGYDVVPYNIVEEVRDELRDTKFAYNLMDMVKLSQQPEDIQRRSVHSNYW